MKATALLLLISMLAFVSVVVRASDVDESDVLILTDENLHQTIQENEYVLVEFYAPWCGHCKNLVPHYAEAATKLRQAGSPVKLGKVDATIHSKVATEFQVRGYPTLKFFKNGVESEYTGGRTASDIVNWLSKKSGPSYVELASESDTASFIAANEIAILGFFDESDTEERKVFLAVADSVDGAKFGIVAKDAWEAYNVKEKTVVAFRKFPEEPSRVDYSGAFNTQDISTFVRGNLLPIAIEFNDQSAQKIFGGDVKTHVLVFISGVEESTAVLSEFRKAAEHSKGKTMFVYVDVDKPSSQRLVDFFSIKSQPDIRLIKLGDEIEKYKMPTLDITESGIKDFVNTYFEGKLERFLMSEDPVPYSGKGVRVLVGTDHDSIVFDPSKNVFVEYYAPWCGHCKKLSPIWDELAKTFDDYENVVIAKMDSTGNEVASASVQGFPTLKFYPAGEDRRTLDFNGNREYEDLKSYVLQNSVGVTFADDADNHGHSHEHGEHSHSHDDF